ncbi:MAG: glycosyltransferase family 4 protein, partial [Rhodobacteraceae bacterium]|nr:glycosyltransferase family 4 protein [Paracoccaceae bacterium]
RHATAFCMASREETFGRSVIESMACGTPVLVHDIPIMHEVTDGQALIVDFGKTGEATAALRRLATDEATRQKLIAGGLQRGDRGEIQLERVIAEQAQRAVLYRPAKPAVQRHAKAVLAGAGRFRRLTAHSRFKSCAQQTMFLQPLCV